MQNDILESLTRLTDAELVARVKSLVSREREATAQLVAHLAELDTRDLYLRAGYPSLHVYCRDAVGLSDGETYNRIEVARAARRFPVILEMIEAGAVSLTAIRLLAPHLTEANHGEILDSARGKKKQEIKEIVARLSPRPDVRFSLRKLPTPPTVPDPPPPPALPISTPGLDSAAGTSAGSPPSNLDAGSKPAVPVIPPQVPGRVSRAAVTPLAPDRYKLELTLPGSVVEKLRLAQDMLGHALPTGDDAALVDRALDALLRELAKRKYAATSTPRPPRRHDPQTPGMPAAVKRIVWVRDLGRCAFVSADGHRCTERRFLEFHHLDPRALGGETSVDLVQLRCRPHNDYEGRLYFGRRRRAPAIAKGKAIQDTSSPSPESELVPEQVTPRDATSLSRTPPRPAASP